MEFSANEARLILALVDERLVKANDPEMIKDLKKLRDRTKAFLKSINEL